MDYNSSLKSLRTDKNQTVDEIKSLSKSKADELKETRRLIEQKYSELEQKTLSDLDRKTAEVYNYCKLIEKNSTMNGNIFRIITKLISIFEGETYVLRELRYHKDNSSPSSVWKIFMIMPERIFERIKDPNYIRERYFHHLLKNGLVMKIMDDWTPYRSDISFYKVDDMGRLNPQVSFKGFPYVKQFVDYIINYRMENNIETLSEEEMQRLRDEFILLNIDNIHSNYRAKLEQRMKANAESISSEYKHKQKILRRIVTKIEENY